MGLKKLAEKIDDYKQRLKGGKVQKIKPGHVEKVLEKLRKKAADLEGEIASEKRKDKKSRLQRKLGIAQEHIERAEWLLAEVR